MTTILFASPEILPKELENFFIQHTFTYYSCRGILKCSSILEEHTIPYIIWQPDYKKDGSLMEDFAMVFNKYPNSKIIVIKNDVLIKLLPHLNTLFSYIENDDWQQNFSTLSKLLNEKKIVYEEKIEQPLSQKKEVSFKQMLRQESENIQKEGFKENDDTFEDDALIFENARHNPSQTSFNFWERVSSEEKNAVTEIVENNKWKKWIKKIFPFIQ